MSGLDLLNPERRVKEVLPPLAETGSRATSPSSSGTSGPKKPERSPQPRQVRTMALARSGLVAKTLSSGILAARQRSRSSVQDLGRYSSRSTRARPWVVA